MELILDLLWEFIDDLLSKYVTDNSKVKPWVKIAVTVGWLCIPLVGCGFIMYLGWSSRDWLSFFLGLGSLLTLTVIYLCVLIKHIKEDRKQHK